MSSAAFQTRRTAVAAVLLGTVLLAGCATTAPPIDVRTEAAPGVPVATRATFAWEESGVSWQGNDSAATVEELRRLVREAVVGELERKGYAPAAAEPDFLVGFHVTVKDLEPRELCTVRNRVFASQPYLEVEVCRPHAGLSRPYRKGTLVVFLVDRATGVLLWQGVGEGTAVSARDARARVRDTVALMFREFPARGGTPG